MLLEGLHMKKYKINQYRMNQFIQVPKELFDNQRYKKLSCYSKLLYGLLLDRMELSRKNNWVNKKDEIYLIYTRKQIQDKLNISDKTCTKVFKELKQAKLIEEERIGLNKPNRIYVGHINYDLDDYCSSNNYDSTTGNIGISKPKDLLHNNTDISNTYSSIYKQETDYIELDINIYKQYQRCINFNITDREIKELIEIKRDVSAEILIKAIELACFNNKKSLSYVRAVIDDWNNKGLDTIEKVQVYLSEWIETNRQAKENYETKIKKQSLKKNNNEKVGFNNFEPRSYDYNALEKKLLGWDKDDCEDKIKSDR